jgi:hypothetical protein
MFARGPRVADAVQRGEAVPDELRIALRYLVSIIDVSDKGFSSLDIGASYS